MLVENATSLITPPPEKAAADNGSKILKMHRVRP
jgi:hypothetical protein